MSWEQVQLVDIVSLRTGKLDSNAAVEDGSHPFFTCAQQTFRIDEPAFNTKAVLLGGNNAAGIFPLKYYEGQFNAYQRTYVIESLDPNVLIIRFLYYALRPALSHFQSASIGAATQYLTKGILDSFKVGIPPIATQNCIVSILSTYDNLIENNRRRIQLLEQAAWLLYKEWFVHLRFPGHEHTTITNGIPAGWERKTLGDVVKVVKGKNITKDSVKNGSVPVVAGGLSPAYYHDTANAVGPVITVSASGANAGYVNLYHEDIWASDCSYISTTSTEYLCYFYLLLTSKQKEVFGFQKGVAQPHVYPKDLQRLPLFEPTKNIVRLFEEFVLCNFKQVKILLAQNKLLTQARDLLLPRLMNGVISM